MRAKYYFGDTYKLDEDHFYSHETMIEYATENWADYCKPADRDAALIMLQNTEGRIVFTYSLTNEDGFLETENYTAEVEVVQMTWLVSELEGMVTRA